MQTIKILKHAAQKLESYFCWVYSNEIASKLDDVIDGNLVRVEAPSGKFLGIAYCNKKSVITLRILSFKDETIDYLFFRKRIQEAFSKRAPLQKQTNAYRVIHSEADFLPGLIVDSYANYLAIQINTAGMERYRGEILRALQEVCAPQGIYDKSDAKVRQKEGILSENGVIYGEIPHEIEIEENGVRFLVNLFESQKTGFYLDQRKNREIVSRYVKAGDTMLDIFCNAGGFGLHALKNRASVEFIDVSESALAQVEKNIGLNALPQSSIIKYDAFKFLTEALEKDARYNMIVLDPPPFAKTKRESRGALKGFRFLVSSALKLLCDDGYVALFSCSHHIGLNELLQNALEASKDANCALEIVERMHADSDHPYVLNLPASDYLSGLLVKKIAL